MRDWLGGAGTGPAATVGTGVNWPDCEKTGPDSEMETRPGGGGVVTQADGGLTWCCLWVARALLETRDSQVMSVTASACTDWREPEPPLLPGSGLSARTPLRESKLIRERGDTGECPGNALK